MRDLMFCILSGILGAILTITAGWFAWWVKRRRAFYLLKNGLRIEGLNLLANMRSVAAVYDVIGQSSEWRVDTSLLDFAKEKLISQFSDMTLLAIVTGVRSVCVSLNRSLDIYRDECFKACLATSTSSPPDYIVAMNGAIRNSFVILASVINDLTLYTGSSEQKSVLMKQKKQQQQYMVNPTGCKAGK